jgi:hypothetical protein
MVRAGLVVVNLVLWIYFGGAGLAGQQRFSLSSDVVGR